MQRKQMMGSLGNMAEQPSVLTRRMHTRFELSDHDLHALRLLDGSGQYVRKGAVVVSRGAAIKGVYVVKSGWAAARVSGPGRKAAITRLYLPGDIINHSELGYLNAPLDVFMISDGSLGFVSRDALNALLHDAPNAHAQVARFDQMEHAATQRRLYAISRLQAEHRLKHFFLSIYHRVNEGKTAPDTRFPFYLQRTHIADLNGLSAVTISIQLSKMISEGSLALAGKMLTLNEHESWSRELQYVSMVEDTRRLQSTG